MKACRALIYEHFDSKRIAEIVFSIEKSAPLPPKSELDINVPNVTVCSYEGYRVAFGMLQEILFLLEQNNESV